MGVFKFRVDKAFFIYLSNLKTEKIHFSEMTFHETTNRRITHNDQQRHRLKEQSLQQDEQETNNSLKKDILIRLATGSEEKAIVKRHLQECHQEERELAIERQIIENEQLRNEREKNEREEEQKRLELERQETEKLRDEKIRQRVREESEEIRQLMAQLDAAYVEKCRKVQLREKEARLEADRKAEAAEGVKADQEMEQYKRSQKATEKAKLIAAEQYQKALMEQVTAREKAKEEAYQQYLKEKKMIDDVVHKIFDEDERQREEERQKKIEVRRFIEEFKEQRRLWNENEKARLNNEADKIKSFEEEQQRRNLERSANEQEEKAQQSEREEKEKRMKDRLEIQRQQMCQMKQKSDRKAAVAAEEEAYRQQMMDKFAYDDKIEQMNAHKRRMKQQEHKREVEQLIEKRRAIEQAKNQRLVEEQEAEKREAAARAQIIEEERQKLLDENAQTLLGFLPKGIMRDTGDVNRLGPEFSDRYKPTTSEDFDRVFKKHRRTAFCKDPQNL